MMRLDKYIQVTRLVKRRVLANQLCDGGRVLRNGQRARASAPVQPGDVLRLDFGWRALEVKVLAVPEHAVDRARAAELYEVVSEQRRPTTNMPGDGDSRTPPPEGAGMHHWGINESSLSREDSARHEP